MPFKSYALKGGVVHKVFGKFNNDECLMMLQNGWLKTNWKNIKFAIYIIDNEAQIELTDEQIDLINTLQKNAKVDKGHNHPSAFYCDNPKSFDRIYRLVSGSHQLGNTKVKIFDRIEELSLFTGAPRKALQDLITPDDQTEHFAIPL
mgnify:CR=1 FL=1